MELLVFLLGIIIAVLGYIFSNFLLKPIRDFSKIRAKIGHKLVFYSHIITSPGSGSLANEASPIIRDLACDLESKYLLIPFLKILEVSKIIPKRSEVIEAKQQLTFLSNSLGEGEKSEINFDALKKVFTSLDIKELVPRYNTRTVSNQNAE